MSEKEDLEEFVMIDADMPVTPLETAPTEELPLNDVAQAKEDALMSVGLNDGTRAIANKDLLSMPIEERQRRLIATLPAPDLVDLACMLKDNDETDKLPDWVSDIKHAMAANEEDAKRPADWLNQVLHDKRATGAEDAAGLKPNSNTVLIDERNKHVNAAIKQANDAQPIEIKPLCATLRQPAKVFSIAGPSRFAIAQRHAPCGATTKITASASNLDAKRYANYPQYRRMTDVSFPNHLKPSKPFDLQKAIAKAQQTKPASETASETPEQSATTTKIAHKPCYIPVSTYKRIVQQQANKIRNSQLNMAITSKTQPKKPALKIVQPKKPTPVKVIPQCAARNTYLCAPAGNEEYITTDNYLRFNNVDVDRLIKLERAERLESQFQFQYQYSYGYQQQQSQQSKTLVDSTPISDILSVQDLQNITEIRVQGFVTTKKPAAIKTVAMVQFEYEENRVYPLLNIVNDTSRAKVADWYKQCRIDFTIEPTQIEVPLYDNSPLDPEIAKLVNGTTTAFDKDGQQLKEFINYAPEFIQCRAEAATSQQTMNALIAAPASTGKYCNPRPQEPMMVNQPNKLIYTPTQLAIAAQTDKHTLSPSNQINTALDTRIIAAIEQIDLKYDTAFMDMLSQGLAQSDTTTIRKFVKRLKTSNTALYDAINSTFDNITDNVYSLIRKTYSVVTYPSPSQLDENAPTFETPQPITTTVVEYELTIRPQIEVKCEQYRAIYEEMVKYNEATEIKHDFPGQFALLGSITVPVYDAPAQPFVAPTNMSKMINQIEGRAESCALWGESPPVLDKHSKFMWSSGIRDMLPLGGTPFGGPPFGDNNWTTNTSTPIGDNKETKPNVRTKYTVLDVLDASYIVSNEVTTKLNNNKKHTTTNSDIKSFIPAFTAITETKPLPMNYDWRQVYNAAVPEQLSETNNNDDSGSFSNLSANHKAFASTTSGPLDNNAFNKITQITQTEFPTLYEDLSPGGPLAPFYPHLKVMTPPGDNAVTKKANATKDPQIMYIVMVNKVLYHTVIEKIELPYIPDADFMAFVNNSNPELEHFFVSEYGFERGFFYIADDKGIEPTLYELFDAHFYRNEANFTAAVKYLNDKITMLDAEEQYKLRSSSNGWLKSTESTHTNEQEAITKLINSMLYPNQYINRDYSSTISINNKYTAEVIEPFVVDNSLVKTEEGKYEIDEQELLNRFPIEFPIYAQTTAVDKYELRQRIVTYMCKLGWTRQRSVCDDTKWIYVRDKCDNTSILGTVRKFIGL